MTTRINNNLLEQTSIVLVETSHPGNIGSAARAMKTMGLSRMVLVNPKRFPSVDATAMAAGADDILASARVVPTLRQAIADANLVIGTSARSRTLPWPCLSPDEIAPKASQTSSAGGQVALVFGRENHGLSNTELESCHYHVQIPANPGFSSLNLAAAVQLLSYELRKFALEAAKPLAESIPETIRLASEATEGLYTHIERVMWGLDFLNPKQPKRLLKRMRALFNRANLTRQELDILRGFLKVVEHKAGISEQKVKQQHV